MSKKAAVPAEKSGLTIIPDPTTGSFAVLPYAEYERLSEADEMREDVADLVREDRADKGELVPHAVVKRLVAGESPLRVWREYRNYAQVTLATMANVPQPTVSDIETGKARGTVATMRRLAKALQIDLEHLLSPEN